jgi:hypothetical protein
MAHDPKTESREERMDSLWASLVKHRRERIRKTMLRPLYQEALKSLYLTAALLIDALLTLQLFMSFTFPINIITALVLLCILLYIEMRVWNAVWGRSGRWSLAKYQEQKP